MRTHLFLFLLMLTFLRNGTELIASDQHFEKLLTLKKSAKNCTNKSELTRQVRDLGFTVRESREIARLFRENLPESVFLNQITRLLPQSPAEITLSGSPFTPATPPAFHPRPAFLATVLEDFQVNENAGDSDQLSPVVAVAPDGNFIVTWYDERNGNYDIYARQFAPTGIPQGEIFRVNDDEGTANQVSPAIAVDDAENFVIVWEDLRRGNFDIYAQRYSADGVPQGTNFLVNDDMGDAFQYEPSVAMDAVGNFVLVWLDSRPEGGRIYAQRYDREGAPRGENFRVTDENVGSSQLFPVIALADSGSLLVAWSEKRYGNIDIYAQRFTADGSPQGANLLVNDGGVNSNEEFPAIAVNDSGRFLVVWRDGRNWNTNIYAQLYTRDGIAQGSNFLVNDDIGKSGQSSPVVAADDSGNFLIIWEDGRDQFYGQRIQRGKPQGLNFPLFEDNPVFYGEQPAIGLTRNGNFVVTWQEVMNEESGNDNEIIDIFARCFLRTNAPQGERILITDDTGSSGQYNPAIAVDDSGNFTIVWRDERDEFDIFAQRFDHTGTRRLQNFWVSSANERMELCFPDIAVAGAGESIMVWDDLGSVYAQLYDFAGHPKGDLFSLSDNTKFTGQYTPAVAMNRDGAGVAVWIDNWHQNPGLFVRQFSGQGNQFGDDFMVANRNIFITEGTPAIAINDSGRFVIAWADNHNAGNYEIYVQPFLADGTPLDSILRVNEDIGNSRQKLPAVAIANDGSFVVAWTDYRNGNSDIFAQRYTPEALPDGVNFQVSDASDVAQFDVALSMNRDGDWIAVWTDYRNGNADIFAQCYTAGDDRRGSNYQVNNDSGQMSQGAPDVALFNDYIYYTWHDNRTTGQGFDIFARIDNFKAVSVEEPDQHPAVPSAFRLFQNFPNPFNPRTSIRYDLPAAGLVSLKIYNIAGQEIITLVEKYQIAGSYSVTWHGNLTNGELAPSGIYLFRLQTGNGVEVRKMALTR